MKMRNLSILLTVISILAVVTALRLISLIEFMLPPDSIAGGLLMHHLLEGAMIGLLMWCVMVVALKRLLAAPLEPIFLDLYAVGRGRQEGLHVHTKVTELAGIVDGINLMLREKR